MSEAEGPASADAGDWEHGPGEGSPGPPRLLNAPGLSHPQTLTNPYRRLPGDAPLS